MNKECWVVVAWDNDIYDCSVVGVAKTKESATKIWKHYIETSGFFDDNDHANIDEEHLFADSDPASFDDYYEIVKCIKMEIIK